MNATELVSTEFVQSDFGKKHVRFLFVDNTNKRHAMRELDVSTALTLYEHREYMYGDNSQIIATDSQKNAIYIMAKQRGIGQIEDFATMLCEFFLRQYSFVAVASVTINEYPWRRLSKSGVEHNHAFEMTPKLTRTCEVTLKRNEKPLVMAGIRDWLLLKTTESTHTRFLRDEYRTLPDADDRVLSSVITASWWYKQGDVIDYDRAWERTKVAIEDKFAGPPDTGINSASVQSTLYIACKEALAKVPQMDRIDIRMPNKHYFDVDFSKFKQLEFAGCENRQVYLAAHMPHGVIHAQIRRTTPSKL